MGTHRVKRDFGAVMIYIISPTRAVLVKDESKRNAQWKIPGGTQIRQDTSIVATAIRKAAEETGIHLLPEDVVLSQKHMRIKGTYYPNFCIAHVSEDTIETRLAVVQQKGKTLRTTLFDRKDVLVLRDLLDRHRSFIRNTEWKS